MNNMHFQIAKLTYSIIVKKYIHDWK